MDTDRVLQKKAVTKGDDDDCVIDLDGEEEKPDSDSDEELEVGADEEDASASGAGCDAIIRTVVRLQKNASLEDFISLVYENLKQVVVVKDRRPEDKIKLREVLRKYKLVNLPSHVQMCLYLHRTDCGKLVPVVINHTKPGFAREVKEVLPKYYETDQDLVVLAGIFEYAIPHLVHDLEYPDDEDDTEVDDTDKLLARFFKRGVTCFITSTRLKYGEDNSKEFNDHREDVDMQRKYLKDKDVDYEDMYLELYDTTRWVAAF